MEHFVGIDVAKDRLDVHIGRGSDLNLYFVQFHGYFGSG